jgi:3-methyladenine DNA glycosylase Tag
MVKRVTSLENLLARAAGHHGGKEAVLAKMPRGLLAAQEIARIPDDRFLSAMTKAIFRAGFVWRVIDNKWPHFEQAFHGFEVEVCAYLPPEEIDALCLDQRIVRHRGKILTVPRNAVMMLDVAAEHGSFARFIAKWPEEDYIGLLDYLARHGDRLGGNSCQYFLRAMGKDGILLTRDVVRALINAGVVDSVPGGRAARDRVQQAFIAWRRESGRSQAEISRILALSTGP